LGCGRAAKYAGDPTTAMRISGPMRTAIMSLATCSPRRTPASYRSVTMSRRLLSRSISPLHVGEAWQKALENGPEHRIDRVLAPGDADRAGRPVPQLTHPGKCRVNLVEGRPKALQQPLPASVGATLRVVRVGSRRPSWASRPRSV